MYRVGIFDYGERIFDEFTGTGETRDAAEADLMNQWVDWLCAQWNETPQVAVDNIVEDMKKFPIEIREI